MYYFCAKKRCVIELAKGCEFNVGGFWENSEYSWRPESLRKALWGRMVPLNSCSGSGKGFETGRNTSNLICVRLKNE